MDTLKIPKASNQTNWNYNDAADVLYLSVGELLPGVGVNMGDFSSSRSFYFSVNS